jgi:hypothetical protein
MSWKENFQKVDKDKRKEILKLIFFQSIFCIILVTIFNFYNITDYISLNISYLFYLMLSVFIPLFVAIVTMSILTLLLSFFSAWIYFGLLIAFGMLFSLLFVFSSGVGENMLTEVIIVTLVLINFLVILNSFLFRWISRRDMSYLKKLAITIILPIFILLVYSIFGIIYQFIFFRNVPF